MFPFWFLKETHVPLFHSVIVDWIFWWERTAAAWCSVSHCGPREKALRCCCYVSQMTCCEHWWLTVHFDLSALLLAWLLDMFLTYLLQCCLLPCLIFHHLHQHFLYYCFLPLCVHKGPVCSVWLPSGVNMGLGCGFCLSLKLSVSFVYWVVSSPKFVGTQVSETAASFHWSWRVA